MDQMFQTADWKTEKHSPVIEIQKDGEFFEVTIVVGKEIKHPNTTEHHIVWIECFFMPEGEKFAVQVGKSEFYAHGASAQGPDTSTIYTAPRTAFRVSSKKGGKIVAFAYCNIHGLWKSEIPV